MIISAKVIKKPKKQRHCERCGDFIEGSQLRLYGAAETSDPPYVIYVHPKYDCTPHHGASGDRKIEKALADIQ